MAKNPAFLFYAKDFLADTLDWSPEELGVYIRLLCKQWEDGKLPIDLTRLARASGCDSEKFTDIWQFIRYKFELKEGHFYNPRLELEREKRTNYLEAQSKKGKEGADKRWGKDSQPHSTGYTKSDKVSQPSGYSTGNSNKGNANEDVNVDEESIKQIEKIRKEVCELFKITEQNQFQSYKQVTSFLYHRLAEGKLSYFIKQFRGYKAEKSNGKYTHSIGNYLARAWNEKEYQQKLNFPIT